jgi:hypothetical protein
MEKGGLPHVDNLAILVETRMERVWKIICRQPLILIRIIIFLAPPAEITSPLWP